MIDCKSLRLLSLGTPLIDKMLYVRHVLQNSHIYIQRYSHLHCQTMANVVTNLPLVKLLFLHYLYLHSTYLQYYKDINLKLNIIISYCYPTNTS
jgi:hypothetical protein